MHQLVQTLDSLRIQGKASKLKSLPKDPWGSPPFTLILSIVHNYNDTFMRLSYTFMRLLWSHSSAETSGLVFCFRHSAHAVSFQFASYSMSFVNASSMRTSIDRCDEKASDMYGNESKHYLNNLRCVWNRPVATSKGQQVYQNASKPPCSLRLHRFTHMGHVDRSKIERSTG